MATELAFIVNPISGKRLKGPERVARVRAFVEAQKLNAVVWPTERAGHAPELAQRALEQGVKRLVAVGGDGTINEVGRMIVGSPCEFGLVPMGSGNGLARHIGIPLEFERALKLAATGSAIKVDTGEANGRPFFNVMGIGFDAEVGRRFNETEGRGLMNYMREGWKAFRGYRSLECDIETNLGSKSLSAYIVAVANSSQYGSNAFIAPDASMTDGKLNLVAIAEPNFLSFFILIWRMFSKKLYHSPRVTPICAESFTLRMKDGGFFHVDGEIFKCGKNLTVKACPKSLRIVAMTC
ncbi:YegS/Rv2252/BmrU family lipid kinase [Pelagicoccus sp. NFK12]|uniref:YegS/Rv2252/BmrU family lipid kinase n=1 Tax=Pelagicoccus enzymogenes TaxID=2773457 RepID=A0A927IHF2_9BACT|nr:YegS/Rv2252/BmrU family lipid kinase [Pelagicoccus enzymogenes]MBD5779385.1 YegS/Rv2252/BmrU family lipid kinase [Pelagicoccus enzymogenes]MDQ8198263.1 YegS/Rv2252/BmrU family lipid kinase [Pelagicoccus enzymogenes]